MRTKVGRPGNIARHAGQAGLSSGDGKEAPWMACSACPRAGWDLCVVRLRRGRSAGRAAISMVGHGAAAGRDSDRRLP
jgi:hypothetical protein